MREVNFNDYQYFVGGAGFVRNVDGEFADRVIIRYMTTNGAVMARATYYADERPAEYEIAGKPKDG